MIRGKVSRVGTFDTSQSSILRSLDLRLDSWYKEQVCCVTYCAVVKQGLECALMPERKSDPIRKTYQIQAGDT
jgi:hypothetical protein